MANNPYQVVAPWEITRRERNLQWGTCTTERVHWGPYDDQLLHCVHKKDVQRKSAPPGKACAAYWNKILVDWGPLPRKMGRRVRESWSTLFYRIGLQDGFSHAYLKCSFRWETRSPSYVAVGHARVVGDIKTANNWSSSSSFDSKICATDTSLILNTLRRMVWTLFTCQVCVDTPLYCVSWKPRACVISLKEYPNDRRREQVCYAYAGSCLQKMHVGLVETTEK